MSQKQIAPRLNMSLQTPNLALYRSLILRIYGATQPGVPHRMKIQLSSCMYVARPKSKILILQQSGEIIMFSGFKSRCSILNLANYLSPSSSPFIILRLCYTVVFGFLRKKLYKVIPSAYSIERQSEFLDSQAPQNQIRLGCLSFLIIWIQFYSEARLSPFRATSFINALTAVFLFILVSSAKQTDAKFPLPIFLIGLKNEWKSVLIRCFSKVFSHYIALGQKFRSNLIFSSPQWSSSASGCLSWPWTTPKLSPNFIGMILFLAFCMILIS